MTATHKPSVLFVCVHNAGRSQMAAGFLAHLGAGRIEVRSAGSAPADQVNPVAVEAMREVGIDISAEAPKILTVTAVQESDVCVTMGCGDACPYFLGKRYLDWTLDDPAGQGIEAVRPIRDEIERRVRALIDELTPRGDEELAEAQREHWSRVYDANPAMYGDEPSEPARFAADRFAAGGVRHVLELGAGHGRDALYFAQRGFEVTAADFSSSALGQLGQAAEAQGVAERVRMIEHDVRERLPLADGSVDGVFAHMLLCMALSSDEIRALVGEVRRVLRPGGVFVYTVRHTGDAHYGAGVSRGDDIYEHGGFAVHFFDRALVDQLAEGWTLDEVHAFEEGELPRRLWRVTQSS